MHDPEKGFVLRYFILEEKLKLGEPTPSYARSEMKLIGADPSKSRDLVSTPRRPLAFSSREHGRM